MNRDQVSYGDTTFRRVFVDDVEVLRTAVADLEGCDALGVDLEMVQRPERKPGGYQEWVQVLALIQVAGLGLSIVIDPLRCRNLTPLRPLMAGSVRKVFLGGGQDDALLTQSGLPAYNVVDVGEVALAIFGRREDGMAALASRFFGMSLDKTVRRADWTARPLNPVLLSYAHRDAELTLCIYRWFQEHHPDVLTLHERRELDPSFPDDTPLWLREAAKRPSADILAILMEHGYEMGRDDERLARELREALLRRSAPRQINRLLRIVGDLGLSQMRPDMLPLIDSKSSMLRSSAARALGSMPEEEAAKDALDRLTDDPVEDVRKAATAALAQLAPLSEKVAPSEPEPETSSLDGNARAALQQLMERMESDSV